MTGPTGDPGTLEVLARHLVDALRPLEVAFTDVNEFQDLMRVLGWDVPGLPASYVDVAVKVTSMVNALEALLDGASAEEVLAVVGRAGDVYRAIGALSEAPAGIDPAVFLPELGRRLFEFLLGRQLLSAAPDWYSGLEALGIIAHEDHPAQGTRPGFVRVRFDWDQIPALLSDPSVVPARVYGWGTPQLATGKLVELLADLVSGLGWQSSLDQLAEDDVAALHDDPPASPGDDANLGLSLTLGHVTLPDGTSQPIGLRVNGLPADGDDLPGMILLPQLPDGVDATIPLGGDWTLRLRAGTDLAQQLGLFVRPGEVGVRYPGAPGQQLPSVGFGVSLVFAPQDTVRLFGQPGQTRLELTGATVDASVDVHGGDPELSVRGSVDGLVLVVNPGGADGFLATILGDDELRVDIPAELSWSSRSGLRFVTTAGIEVTVNPNVDFGFVRVDRVTLAVAAGEESLTVRARAAFSGSLGPFSYVVDGFGVALPVTFTDGNAGPFDIDLGATPPTGVGLAVDAGAVSGGGFLSYDPERGEYSGALELELADFIAVKAIGLISTRQPDGSSGFSLLIVLTAEFASGIQLGAGFRLLAVGGLVGLNRGMNLAALVEGVRTGSIESVAFPKDVVANAPRILSDLAKFFPSEQGTFLIGPMAKIGWGTPTLVAISLGVIIEIPGNIAVLGVLRAALPTVDDPLVVIQAQFVGALELDKSRLWFFARLFDSRILTMTVDGGMGVLVAWGDDPDLVLTVGGFHPSYRPPPLPFPVPDRLSVDLLNRNGQLIRVSGYFALTSNTLQFGAKAEIRLGFSAFRVEGHLGFDGLFQRSPFRFAVHISAHVSLKAFGVGTFGIDLDFQLEGPAPWRAHGRGRIGFLFFSISANFDITWGEDRDTTLPPVEVLALLAAEIDKTEGWETRLPSGGNRALVTLRELPDTGDLVLHPLGTLFVRQRAVPLNVRVDRIGGQRATDGRRFGVILPDDSGLTVVDTTGDKFAMGQYQDLSEAAVLSRPSYETQDAGLELTADDVLASARVVRRSARYELHLVDSGPADSGTAVTTLVAQPEKRFHSVNTPVFDELRRGSSTSRAALSGRRERQKQPFTTTDTVRVNEQRFVVAYTKSNRQAFPPRSPGQKSRPAATFRSQASAEDALLDFTGADPSLTGRLHVIPVAEAIAGAGVPGTWAVTGVLPTPVTEVELGPLATGRVLLAGGSDQNGAPVAATALFDPTADSWADGPALGTARERHTTTGLPDGHVLAAGGRGTDGALASSEVFDPAAASWTPAPNLGAARYGHSATRLRDGRVLVAGGSGGRAEQEDGALTSAEVFAAGVWTPTGSMTDARTGHQAVLLPDNRVLVVGGALPRGNGEEDALAFCELFDPTEGAGTWSPTGSLNQPRKGHQATLLPDGRVLVTGGDPVVAEDGTLDPHSLDTAELYDPVTGRWSRAAPMPGGRSRHRAVTTRSGFVLVTGGTGAPELTAGYRSVIAYDPDRNTWTTVDGLNLGRAGHAMAELTDDRVLVAAGTAAGTAAAGTTTEPADTGEVLIP